MNARNLFVVGCAAIAVASFAQSASAGDTDLPIRRADVVAEVLRASALGTLVPAGERTPILSAATASASLARSDVKRATRMAAHNSVLLPAGETTPYVVSGGEATMTRAERKAEVLRARATGELMAAGEGTPPSARRASDIGKAAQGESERQMAGR